MHEAGGVRIECGDCLVAMRGMAESTIDAIVTDPPYGLEFMGKDWDRLGKPKGFRRQDNPADISRDNAFGRTSKRAPEYAAGKQMQDWHELWAIEALRVAKPGAHLLAFGGTRTHHRLMCAIEDAGWEIRDCLGWIYGSGFPKSMDVSKAIDRAAGAEREVVGQHGNAAGSFGTYNTDASGPRHKEDIDLTVSATDAAKEWDGWGTALKPAWEPIVLARKPLEGTVANNVQKWGVGALNIDGCRVAHNEECKPIKAQDGGNKVYGQSGRYEDTTELKPLGRFPANLIHDGSEEVLECFPDSNGQQGDVKGTEPSNPAKNVYGEYERKQFESRSDTGSAARFFYCAKASKSDRTPGNNHPTVKPVDLMRYLVRLVCPAGGTVLDPFNGSGTTTYAAREEGCKAVGIDKDESYCEIAIKRLKQHTLSFGE